MAASISENETRISTGTATSPNLENKQFVCSICVENYTNPRYLPTCGHTFCEQCLFAYACNLQQDERKFECPVCRKSAQNFPGNTDVTLEWIQNFPLNTVIIQMMESSPSCSRETDQVKRKCDPCDEQGETITGVHFCVECKEMLCGTCSNYHKKFKATKNHKQLDAEDMQVDSDTDKTDVISGITKCSNHTVTDREVEFCCKTHDTMICAVCAAKEHKPCDTIDLADMDIDSTKFTEDSETIITQMKSAIEHIHLLQKLRTENKKGLISKLKYIKANIHQVRDQAVEVIDKAVRHVADVAKQTEIEKEDEIDADMTRVGKLIEPVEQTISLLDAVKHHGSDRQKFISIHLMKKQTEQIGKQITNEDRHLKTIDTELKIGDDIRNLIDSADVEKFVNIRFTDNDSDHVHLGTKSSMPGTNFLKNSRLVKTENHKVDPDNAHLPTFPSVAAGKDGQLILPDYCKDSRCLCVYNPVDKALLKLQLHCVPYSATQIDDTHIAVGFPRDKTISIVTVGDKLKVEKSLKLRKGVSCIVALNNGQLAVAVPGHPATFNVIDISGTEVVYTSQFEQDTNGRKFKCFENLAVDKRRQHVIQPCVEDVAVYCFDITAVPIFKYTHRELKNPQGVALDICGNIYVCDFDSSSIHKISPLGEPVSITTEGIPCCPRAICGDNNGTGFWVTNESPVIRDMVTYYKLEQE